MEGIFFLLSKIVCFRHNRLPSCEGRRLLRAAYSWIIRVSMGFRVTSRLPPGMAIVALTGS